MPSYGNVMKFVNGEFKNIPVQQTGFSVRGDSKSAKILKLKNGKNLLMVTRNNEALSIFVVRLKGALLKN